jgi:transcriptional regulator with XRE-family HTH domain
MQPRTFSERLTFAQEHSGMTLAQLAAHTNVPLTLLEREQACSFALPKILTVEHLTPLCKALNVSWAWLVEGECTPRGRAAADRMRTSGSNFLDVEELQRACDLLEALP